jgi:hypothetical protein
MKPLHSRTVSLLSILSLALLSLLCACSPGKRELNQANLTHAMNDYLAKRGDLCLAMTNWPVFVSEAESHAGSRNALQMPVLQRLGLVSSRDALIEQVAEDGGKSQVHALRYDLTAEGRKYYLARAPHRNPTGNRYLDVDHDFCAARLSLDKVVGWEPSATPGAKNEAVVSFTYKVDPAPWTADSALRAVFPMVDAVIRGAGTMQLKEGVVLGANGWEARDL